VEAGFVPFTLNRDPKFLAQQALDIRRDIIAMLTAAGSGHTGGSLSMADLITALYFAELKHDPAQPKWPGRDRFILSKGHAAPALYAVLARTGYFPAAALATLRKLGSILQGHPDMNKTPGVEMSTGSLGQGLSVACGMAAAARAEGGPAAYRVYAILGDGELDEGQVWEAAMSAAHYGLSNLCALVDHNGLQIDGAVCQVMNIEPIRDKWAAFNWHTLVIDGHDYCQILAALDAARAETAKPTVIIAKTVKGKGVSFTENQVGWHGVAPNEEQACKALEELK
jgi:transketolase